MTKTITNAQMIGSQGESFVSERANAMGFLFTRHGPLEAGIDGFLEIRDPKSGTPMGQAGSCSGQDPGAGCVHSRDEVELRVPDG